MRSTETEQVIADLKRQVLTEAPQPSWSSQVTEAAAARLPRQSLATTRADLIAAGKMLVHEYINKSYEFDHDSLHADTLPFVRLEEALEVASDIARKRLEKDGRIRPDERIAPLTPGAFYKAFADTAQGSERGAVLTAFRRLVSHEMITDPLLANAAVYVKLGLEMQAAGEPWSEVVRVGAEIEYLRWLTNPALILTASLAVHRQDRAVTGWLQDADERRLTELVDLYSRLLEAFGRQMRPGIPIKAMAASVTDCISGMALNSLHNPAVRQEPVEVDVDGTGTRKWPLCSLAAWSIYSSFTELSR